MAPTPNRKRKEAEMAPSLTTPPPKATKTPKELARERARRSMERSAAKTAAHLKGFKEPPAAAVAAAAAPPDAEVLTSPAKKRRVSLTRSASIQAQPPPPSASPPAPVWSPPAESRPTLTKSEQRRLSRLRAIRASERSGQLSSPSSQPVPRFSPPPPQAQQYLPAPVVPTYERPQQQRPFIPSPSMSVESEDEESLPPHTTAREETNKSPGSDAYVESEDEETSPPHTTAREETNESPGSDDYVESEDEETSPPHTTAREETNETPGSDDYEEDSSQQTTTADQETNSPQGSLYYNRLPTTDSRTQQHDRYSPKDRAHQERQHLYEQPAVHNTEPTKHGQSTTSPAYYQTTYVQATSPSVAWNNHGTHQQQQMQTTSPYQTSQAEAPVAYGPNEKLSYSFPSQRSSSGGNVPLPPSHPTQHQPSIPAAAATNVSTQRNSARLSLHNQASYAAETAPCDTRNNCGPSPTYRTATDTRNSTAPQQRQSTSSPYRKSHSTTLASLPTRNSSAAKEHKTSHNALPARSDGGNSVVPKRSSYSSHRSTSAMATSNHDMDEFQPPVMNHSRRTTFQDPTLNHSRPAAPVNEVPTASAAARHQTQASAAAFRGTTLASPVRELRSSRSLRPSQEFAPVLYRMQEDMDRRLTSSIGSLATDLNLVEQDEPESESTQVVPKQAPPATIPSALALTSFLVLLLAITLMCGSGVSNELAKTANNETRVLFPPASAPPCFMTSEGGLQGPVDVMVCKRPEVACPHGGICYYGMLHGCVDPNREVSLTANACVLTKEANESLAAASPCFLTSEGGLKGPANEMTCKRPEVHCPQDGICQYGALHRCVHRHREVAPTADECILTNEANETLLAAEKILSTWTMQHVCSAEGCPFVVQMTDETAAEHPWFQFSQLMGELDIEWDLELFQQVPNKFSVYSKNDTLLIGLSNNYIEKVLPVPTWCTIQKSAAGCLKVLVQAIVSMFHILVFGALNVFWTYPVQSLSVSVVLYAVIYLVRLRTERGKLRSLVVKVRRMASQRLQDAAPEVVPVLHVRDEIAWELYPDGGEEQRYFKTQVWARVFKDLEQDNRIRKETRVVDRKQERTWQWLAVTPRKH